MSLPKIVAAVISAPPNSFFDSGTSSVMVDLDNGTQDKLFEFYSDELQFTESELIGLTVEEGRNLKRTKDIAYLRD